MSIGHPKQGSWQQKWMDIEWLLTDLRRLYSTETVSNVTLRLLVEGVLKACRELADWLWAHPDETGMTKNQVLNFVHAHPQLSVCDGFAQTSVACQREGTGSLPRAWDHPSGAR